MRASSVPNLYAGCLNKCSCNFLFVAEVGLCCGFCDFAVSFLVPPDGPSFSFVLLPSCACGRLAVPFLGPCLGSFFEVFCIRVAEAQSFGFNETLWLMATGRATVVIKEEALPLKEQPEFPALALLASRGLLAPDAWKCKRAQVSLKATIDVPMLGTIIEQNGDGLLEDSHIPVG